MTKATYTKVPNGCACYLLTLWDALRRIDLNRALFRDPGGICIGETRVVDSTGDLEYPIHRIVVGVPDFDAVGAYHELEILKPRL